MQIFCSQINTRSHDEVDDVARRTELARLPCPSDSVHQPHLGKWPEWASRQQPFVGDVGPFHTGS